MKIRCLLLALTTIVCILCLCGFVYADHNKYIQDPDDLIDQASEKRIAEALEAAEIECGTPIRAYVYKSTYYLYSPDEIIDEYEELTGENFIDIALLAVSYEYGTYYYELLTYGEAYTAINDREANRILDNSNIYDNIKAGDLEAGIISYADITSVAISGALRPNLGKVIIASAIISLIVASAICLSLFFAYKKKLHAESYPLSRYASLSLIVERDTFITKFVTRVRIRNSSSSSGGRMSGGGGRSGGSRGRR